MGVKPKKRVKSRVRRPSAKQAKLARLIADPTVEAATMQDLLLRAGYAHGTVKATPSDVFSSKGVQTALANLGVTPEMIAKPMIDAAGATQSTFYRGELIETDAPDHHIRLKAVDQLANITGMNKTVVESRNINVNVNFDEIEGLI